MIQQSEVIDISSTIVPKSDQLNADQLLNGPLTIIVTRVTMRDGEEQPVSVFYDGDKGRPFKPCKTMRKLLAYAWGANAAEWTGRAMTLCHDPDVKFGAEVVGGVRISHLSDITSDIRVSLTSTRGKKAMASVRKMARPESIDHLGLINAAATMDELKVAFETAIASTKDRAKRAQYTEAKDARKDALSAPASEDTGVSSAT